MLYEIFPLISIYSQVRHVSDSRPLLACPLQGMVTSVAAPQNNRLNPDQLVGKIG